MSIIDLNTADIFNAIGGGSPLSIIDSVLHPQYVIRNSTTGAVSLEFSGMASIQPSGRAQITNAPVEGGKYQSINKVKEPSVVRCEIIVTGLTGFSGGIPNIFDLTFTSQSSVLETIKTMLSTANTYDIETPKETLESYDLVARANRKQSVPGSKRMHSKSDALYLGGFLNQAPTQYVEFADNKINIVAPNGVNITTPDMYVSGNIRAGGDITDNVGTQSASLKTLRDKYDQHKHPVPGVQTGGSTVTSNTTDKPA